jgi:hypothetical protein
METTMKKQIDINRYLASNQQIAAIWGTEDVQAVRPDLDTDQAWKVLQQVDRDCLAEYGITWDTLRDTAEDLYGPAPEADED